MKTKLVTRLTKFARNNKYIYSFVHFFRKRAAERSFKQSLANFHQYGLEALTVFNDCMETHGYKYSIAFGTLLGAIREHDFIPHDDDIDVAMWYSDYEDGIIADLAEAGIKLIHSFSVDNDRIGKELTFEYKKVLIDIFFFYRDDEGRAYCCDFINYPGCSTRKDSIREYGGLLPRQLYLPLGDNLARVPFKSITVNIPTNYDEILSFRYGPDYLTPKPGWKPKTESIIEMHDNIGVYTNYK